MSHEDLVWQLFGSFQVVLQNHQKRGLGFRAVEKDSNSKASPKHMSCRVISLRACSQHSNDYPQQVVHVIFSHKCLLFGRREGGESVIKRSSGASTRFIIDICPNPVLEWLLPNPKYLQEPSGTWHLSNKYMIPNPDL